jgi:HK97 gp10 family phage protein
VPAVLRSRLPEIAAAIPVQADIGTRSGAGKIEEAAKVRVPRRTGLLGSRIHVERNGLAEYRVVAGDAEAYYGHFLEHGTDDTAAQPFFEPAVEDEKDETIHGVQERLAEL